MSLAPDLADIEYPESNGRPMGQTDVHRAWMIRLYDLLSYRYRGQRVYVASDLLLYDSEVQPYEYVVPDEFVVLDCDRGQRRTLSDLGREARPQCCKRQAAANAAPARSLNTGIHAAHGFPCWV
jgi:hypothetical protein